MLDTETLDKRLREAVERFVLRLGELADEAARQRAAAAAPAKTDSGQPDEPAPAPVEAVGQPDEPAPAPVEAAGQPDEPASAPVEAAGQPDEPASAPVEAVGQPDEPALAPVEQPHADRVSLPGGLTETEEKLLLALQQESSGLTTTQLAEHTGCTLVPVFEAINRLMEKRLIERVDRGLELSQYRLRL